MKSNNQILERYNPAKEDKKKLAGKTSPKGMTVRVDERTEIVVPLGLIRRSNSRAY